MVVNMVLVTMKILTVHVEIEKLTRHIDQYHPDHNMHGVPFDHAVSYHLYTERSLISKWISLSV